MADEIHVTITDAQPINVTIADAQPINVTIEGGISEGEANVGENLGTGVVIYAGKDTNKLQFKSLVEGNRVNITSTGNEITFDVDVITSHTGLSDIGVNTHAQIDTHITETDNALSKALSTGLFFGGYLSINGSDPTKFDITEGCGCIIDNSVNPSVRTKITWVEQLGISIPNIASWQTTYVSIDVNGNFVFRDMEPTKHQKREEIFIGWLDHPDNAEITDVGTEPEYAAETYCQLSDTANTLGKLNRFGNEYYANDSNLMINRSAGEVFAMGANYVNDVKSPNITIHSLDEGLVFYYSYRDTAELSGWYNDPTDQTTIDPNQYDDGDGLSPVPTGKFTVQQISFYPIGDWTSIQYGQEVFDTLQEAEALGISEIEINPYNAGDVIRCYLVVQEGCTDLSDTDKAKFINIGKFGTTSAGGSAGGGGEANTASNIGTEGIGVFALKSGVDLQFKNIVSKDAGLIVTNNETNKTIELDLSLTKSDVGLGNVANADTTTTANITDSLDKRFVTDAQQTVIGNTSGVNTGDQDLSGLMVKSQNLSDVNNRQTSLNNLTAVSGATNEYVLTKDTSTGNAIWKVSSGGGGSDLGIVEAILKFKNTYSSAYLDPTYTDGLPTTIDVWDTYAKVTKLFTQTITYTDGLPTTISIVDEILSKTLTKTISYASGLPKPIQWSYS
jgi:hypothetical protein